MKKGGWLFLVVLLTVVLVSSTFISAGWFSDVFNKLTGNVVSDSETSNNLRTCAMNTDACQQCNSNGVYDSVIISTTNITNPEIVDSQSCRQWCEKQNVTGGTCCSYNAQANYKLRNYKNVKGCWLTNDTSIKQGCSDLIGEPNAGLCASNLPATCNFTYSAWGACNSSGIQTRTILTKTPAGCTGGNYWLKRNCTYVPPINITCTDSDGGLNYTVKGTVKLNDESYTDFCPFSAEVTEYACNSTTNSIYTLSHACGSANSPTGCLNGACLNANTEPNPSCFENYKFEIASITDNREYQELVLRNINTGSSLVFRIGSTLDIGNLEIKAVDISYSDKTVVLSVNSPGIFDYLAWKDKSYKTINSRIIYLNKTRDSYFVVSYCGNVTSTCTDSDGGLVPNVYGKTNFTYGSTSLLKQDECALVNDYNSSGDPISWMTDGYSFSCSGEDCYIQEAFCKIDDADATKMIKCSNGCANGACIDENSQRCSSLIDSVKNPKSAADRILSGNWTDMGHNFINGVSEEYTEYGASWYWNSGTLVDENQNSINYYNVQKQIQVYDNKNVDLSNEISWNKNDPACKANVYEIDGKENTYFICNWNIFNNQQDLTNNYNHNNRQIFWYNDNVVVRIYLYWGVPLTDAQITKLSQQKLNELMTNLVNNQYEYVDWSNFDIPDSVFQELYVSLNSCGSDVVFDRINDSRDWSCKTEPVICPEYGSQKRTCSAWNPESNKEDIQEYQISCSPGLCSGCYTPKWFDEVTGDNRCIPYGFRFESQIGSFLTEKNQEDQEILTVRDTDTYEGVNLTVYADGSANLQVDGWNNQTYVLEKGQEFTVDLQKNDLSTLKLFVNDIVYDSVDYKNSFIDITFTYTYMGEEIQTMNAYCDIDGQIKQQKLKDSNGEWARCQNNYECDSNLCSSGECIELVDLAKSAGVFKSVFVKSLCKIAHLLSTENYNECIYNYLGSA